MFRVGMKVVCVRGPYTLANLPWRGATDVKIGSIYTIRSINTSPRRPELGVSLLFDEIVNPIHPNGLECGFYSSRFRPIVERKTEISIFKAMLTPAWKKERVS